MYVCVFVCMYVCVCFEAGGRMINASEPADIQQMRDPCSFVRFSCIVSSRVYTLRTVCQRVKGSADGHEITTLPASWSEIYLFSFPLSCLSFSLSSIDCHRLHPSNIIYTYMYIYIFLYLSKRLLVIARYSCHFESVKWLLVRRLVEGKLKGCLVSVVGVDEEDFKIKIPL